jgi:beta-lactamase regulating signal transducer with metallopeptidase domain
MILPGAHEVIPVAVERTLDSLVGGLALSAAAWIWLRVARRQDSASRFFILFILLIGIAVLPIAGLSWIHPASSLASTAGRSWLTLPENAAAYLFLAWAAIATAGLARIVVGFVQLGRLRRSCVEVQQVKLNSQVHMALQESPRAAVLCTSEHVTVPTALGLASPAKIAIPAWLIDQLSPEELHHLVLHELAHLRRWDDWTNLAQRVLGALLFFHPAIWWLQSRLALEREMACDECVLAQTRNARAYARSLANMAERSFVRRTAALAQAAVSRLHDTTLRVAKILSPASNRRSTSAAPLFASVAVVGGLTLMAALCSPDLVSFTQAAVPATIAAVQPRITAPLIEKTSWSPKITPVAKKRTITPQPAGDTVAHLGGSRSPGLIPAKAVVKNNTQRPRPAMLVVWQETYENGAGMVVQRTYWRVVVLQQPINKQQPQKNI